MHASDQTAGTRLCEHIRALSAAHDQLAQVYAEQHGIYQTDFRALLIIDRPDDQPLINAGELATALGLSSGAVTYLVERLAHSGHVRREVDPKDRRKVLLACTRKGREALRGYDEPLSNAIGEALGDMADVDLEKLGETCTQLRSVIEQQTQELLDHPPVKP